MNDANLFLTGADLLRWEGRSQDGGTVEEAEIGSWQVCRMPRTIKVADHFCCA